MNKSMPPERASQPQTFRPRRVAELVADELRRQIISGELDRDLPTEEVLLERYAVSRPSLREAFRILETESLIRVRRGKLGGAEILRPTAVSTAYHLGLLLQSKNVQLSDVAAARLVIEPACSLMAATRPDRAAVAAELETLIAASEELLEGASATFTISAQRFHDAITRLCGNVTMTTLASALEVVWNTQEQLWAEAAVNEGNYPEVDLRGEVIRAHKAIARRIAKGDSTGASNAMRTHLELSQPFVNLRDAPVAMIDSASHG
jgi:GntR family transcriptional repressor for pyruvate dehydrogenase complex